MIDTLPYSHSRCVDPAGFSGSIWLLCNEGLSFSVKIITCSEHNIHTLVKVPSPSLAFLLTTVYASPQFIKHKPFLDYLQNLAMNISLPWILLGDFNDMIYEEEKLGGLLVNRTCIAAFRNCLDKCGLIDLGFHGPRFTWTNKSPTWQSTIKERLDRGLGNADWTLLFPSTEIHHLPRVKSNHCLIMLNTDPSEPKPFRFEQMWLTDPTFPSLVKDSWKSLELIPSASSPLSRFLQRLNVLTKKIRSWNKTHFDNVFHRKTRLIARLRGI